MCVCLYHNVLVYTKKIIVPLFFFLIGKIKKYRNKEETPKQRLQVHRKYIVEA